MIVAAALLLAGAGSLALIARELRKAPEGYEDDHDFHIVQKGAVGVPGSMTTKTRRTRSSGSRPMRQVHAH